MNTTHTSPPPAVAQDAPLYTPTPVTPEEAFQAIGRLRKAARDEIDRLLQFLDKTDDYVSRELEDQVDDGPCDDNELDGPENGEDEESEPDEPSLGSGAVGAWSSQAQWASGTADDMEDEHCGAEPEHENYDGQADDEASLGWTAEEAARGRTYAGAFGRSVDFEEGDPARPPQNRTVIPGADKGACGEYLSPVSARSVP